MKDILLALGVLILFIPISIFGAAWLWNHVLVNAVTWANPVSFWEMAGLMLLLWILWPGTKAKIKTNNNDE